MTRKHFEAIAALLRKEYDYNVAVESQDAANATIDIATNLADYFETTNPNFNRGRFMLAALGWED